MCLLSRALQKIGKTFGKTGKETRRKCVSIVGGIISPDSDPRREESSNSRAESEKELK
jgi:hypothetical protein